MNWNNIFENTIANILAAAFLFIVGWLTGILVKFKKAFSVFWGLRDLSKEAIQNIATKYGTSYPSVPSTENQSSVTALSFPDEVANTQKSRQKSRKQSSKQGK